jgi:ElaB/YqjD/DUF883 family membrane-anchored ribosome-binding protein
VTDVSEEIGIADRIQDKMVQASDKLAVADHTIRKFARERPITAVLAAVTVGYLVGRVLSRL